MWLSDYSFFFISTIPCLNSRTAATPKIRNNKAFISRPLKKMIKAITTEIRLNPKKIIARVFMVLFLIENMKIINLREKASFTILKL
jgi:hypothetical protein